MSRTNLRQFLGELERFADGNDEDLARLQRKVSLELLTRVVLKTPVDTGRARGNWQLSIGKPASGTVQSNDRGGNEAIQRGAAEIGRLRRPTIAWLTNNLPYIERLENGYSRQTPAGMLAVSVGELRGMFR